MLKRVVVATVVLACPATAQTPAAPPAAPRSSQAVFDAAQAAFDKSDWKAAVTGYRDVLAHMKPTSRSAPPVHARLATALAQSGDGEGALAEVSAAINGFTALGVSHDDDLAAVYMLRGDQQRSLAQNDQAIGTYQSAIAAATGPDSRPVIYSARVRLAYAAMTEKPDLAAAALDTEIADTAFFSKQPKAEQARVLANRAMAELNRGDAKEAAHFIEKALELSGRTSSTVTMAQVEIRGDAALIYAKLGRNEDVRQYLTYSGAGHLPSADWLQGADMPLPVCDSDVHPDDVAVVEFAIGSSGRTVGAAPLYASRPGPIGSAFAASVRTWRWRPAAAAKLNAFWRAAVRMELRCVKRPPAVELVDSFADATEQWLAQIGHPIDLSDPSAVEPVAAVGDRNATIAHDLFAVRHATSGKAAEPIYATLDQNLVAAQAPVAVRAYAAFETMNLSNRGPGGAARAARLAAQADRFAGYGAAREAAWFRAEAGLQLEASGDLEAARTHIQAVVALPTQTLPADDPIRSLALLHLSLIDKRGGKAAVAESRLAAAGVDAEQCSLLDVRPVARNTQISTETFPSEAARWHFEGRVSEAFDIGADGSVADVRTVIAYPPFVFGKATEHAVQQFRYLPPTLDNQALGCTGERVNVRFVLPG